MREFVELIGRAIGFVLLIVGVTFGLHYFTQPHLTEVKNNVKQELIKELDTNKKIVVFEFEKITDTIEEEQKILEELIDEGFNKNYIISTIEVIEGNNVLDRTILIFENGY